VSYVEYISINMNIKYRKIKQLLSYYIFIIKNIIVGLLVLYVIAIKT